MKKYYETLEVSTHASRDEIQAAFRKLAKKYHPDSNSVHASAIRFQEILEAYDLLNDPDKRRKYDLDCTVLDQIDIFQAFTRARDEALKRSDKYQYNGRRGGQSGTSTLQAKITKTSYLSQEIASSTWSHAKRKVSSLIRAIGSGR